MRYGWSLEKSDWEACVAYDSEWKKATLNPLRQDLIPTSAGVYAICAPAALLRTGVFENLYNVIYIGRASGAGGLRQRFLTHCNRPAPQLRRAKECFGEELDYWFHQLNEKDVALAESRLIECLGPVVNLVRGVIEARIGEPRPA